MRALLFPAALLASCVPSARELRAPVDHLVGERLGASLDPRAGPRAGPPIDALLARPLDASAAIRIALANSPRMQAAYDELDIAAGDVAAALGLGPLNVDAKLKLGGSHDEVELDAIQDLLGLVLAPRRRAAARAELAAARATAAATALRLAAQVEIAFTDLLAAQQELELRRTAFDAADAAATVRDRMRAAGNTSALATARERDAREQARIELGRAEAAIEVRRDALDALLGLSGERTKWSVTGTLRAVPAAAPTLDAIEAQAVAASLELTAGRERREAAENRAAAERLRTILPELGVGVAITTDTTSASDASIGPALRIGIPLFDPRTGERARARALVRREGHQLAAQAIELRAAARAARITALATYQEARHLHDVVLPLRQQIVDETLKHYNAMDADPFALVVARRELVDAGHQYLDALRRHWNAMTEVTALLRGVMLAEPAPAAHEAER
jgi:outer membrane protein TolC